MAATVAWTVPYGTDLTKLAPAYTVSAMASGSPASGTLRNFSTPQTYTLTAQDGSTKVHTVTAIVDPNSPSSSGATLTVLEDTATTLTAGNFGYADPNSVALAAVRITSLPAKGTLKNSGTAVLIGELPLTVAAADIGNLTYQPALNANGAPYTTIGIKVRNANNLWSSADAVMTVNVTPVNDPPTSTGGSVTLKGNTVKTFAATDFQFSDVDGDTLGAIKVTSLPTHGILKLGGSPITSVPGAAIPVANIGTLTYTPAMDISVTDSFKFQVRDAAAFSADATMAITVTSASTIAVQNGSFETPGGINNATYWWSLGSPWTGGISPQGYEVLDMRGWEGATFSSAADGFFAANMETWIVSITQNLATTVNAGDTLSVTFSGGRAKGQTGGKLTATFVVGTTEYTSSEFDTALQAANTWQSHTFTTPITNTGNLSLKFSPVSGRPWLDKISDVTLKPGAGSGTYAGLGHRQRRRQPDDGPRPRPRRRA